MSPTDNTGDPGASARGERSAGAGVGAIHVDRAALRAYPPTVTFRDLIRKNKRRSTLLMAALTMFTVVVAGAIAGAAVAYGGATEEDLIGAGVTGAAAGCAVALIACVWSWYGGAKAILAMSGAHPIEKRDDPELFNVVEELSIAAGIPMPRVYRIESDALNAFATGRDPKHAAVAITRGLRERLTRDELAGVMAHEISHVRHYDIRFAMLMATQVGLIVFACDAFRRGAFRSARMSRRSAGKKDGAAAAGAIIMVVALLLSILAPIIATLIHLAFSRQREYLADAGAVELTRHPEGLASALQKLGGSPVPLAQANRATEHLYIVKPLFDEDKDGRADPGSVQNANSVFSTHPPMEKRIARLMALVR